MLIWRGLPYVGLIADPDVVGLEGANSWGALVAAGGVGVAKGFTALRKAGRRAVTHLIAMGEDAPFWTLFAPRMLPLVGLMIGLGLVLRLAPYNPMTKAWIVGILYPAIGVALLIGGQLVRSAAPLVATPAEAEVVGDRA